MTLALAFYAVAAVFFLGGYLARVAFERWDTDERRER